jgi:hypothetical protein
VTFTAEQIRTALEADGYTDPPAVGDQFEDLAATWLPDGHQHIVTITGLWKITAGWSSTVVRREVDGDGVEVPSGCGEGRIFVDHLLAGYRKVEES